MISIEILLRRKDKSNSRQEIITIHCGYDGLVNIYNLRYTRNNLIIEKKKICRGECKNESIRNSEKA